MTSTSMSRAQQRLLVLPYPLDGYVGDEIVLSGTNTLISLMPIAAIGHSDDVLMFFTG
jgi:hypothetical protein